MAGARRKRPRPKLAEIAAAVAVVLAGVGLIAAIVLLDPRWQRQIASHGDGIAVGPPEAIAARGGDRDPRGSSPTAVTAEDCQRVANPLPLSGPIHLLWFRS